MKKKNYFYTKNPIDLIYLREYLFSQDSKKMFQSLVSLVIHHSVMPECLPCPLILSHSDIGSDDENHVNKQLSTSCQWVSFKIEIENYIFYYNHPANLRNYLNKISNRNRKLTYFYNFISASQSQQSWAWLCGYWSGWLFEPGHDSQKVYLFINVRYIFVDLGTRGLE